MRARVSAPTHALGPCAAGSGRVCQQPAAGSNGGCRAPAAGWAQPWRQAQLSDGCTGVVHGCWNPGEKRGSVAAGGSCARVVPRHSYCGFPALAHNSPTCPVAWRLPSSRTDLQDERVQGLVLIDPVDSSGIMGPSGPGGCCRAFTQDTCRALSHKTSLGTASVCRYACMLGHACVVAKVGVHIAAVIACLHDVQGTPRRCRRCAAPLPHARRAAPHCQRSSWALR